ncbi:molybdenum cofactor synthesis domain protein [Methanolacinia petrolearia DSM 11571]|uniref:Molybdenum cofactor synthesis domain protein n=1 Tax=Methanolacinia petrolearia (strain DSM 11571 / OCM 486 / SEBR 4847) TaxID=679926 RepID=E1RED4_METP4|nr:substrate-binding domain-containing protein [Methanolacinia petrolearia]ADN37177.1 molybdenum cofactor synthesis domain protein [Methanolacinia petrolearia DSM 11571]
MVKRYLSQITLDEAVEKVLELFGALKSSGTVPLAESAGRVAASPVYAEYSVPVTNVSAMDGVALKSSDTFAASEQNPVSVRDFLRVNTGNAVPLTYDAVVMIEDVWFEEKGEGITIRKSARPWQNVRAAGEDIKQGELIVPKNYRIRPFDIGALGTYGVTDPVVKKLRAGLIPTGSELVPIGTRPGPGQVVESNITMAAAWLGERNVDTTCYPPTPDDPEMIRDVISEAVLENDIIIVSAGSSAGTRDFTAGAIGDLGRLVFHGISMMPGKPMILGEIEGKPVIGLPGYPISAQVVLREILGPLLDTLGFSGPPSEKLEVSLAGDLTSNVGYDEFVLLSVAKHGDHYIASQQSRGAGVQMASIRSNAYLRLPAPIEGYAEGESVFLNMTRSIAHADRSLLVTGIMEPPMGWLSNILSEEEIWLHNGNTGNISGIIALKKDICHAAALHALSAEGGYNTEYIRQYMPGEEIHMTGIAGIILGIASKTGIGIDELPGSSIVNQPAGSECRIVLDRLFSGRSIDPESVNGYSRVVNNPLSAAIAVAGGNCDAALTSYSIAKTYGLEFEPVAVEQYELAVRAEHMQDERVMRLIDAISSEEFRRVLDDAGSYDSGITGKRRIIQ